MSRKILLTIFTIAFIASLIAVGGRHNVERNVTGVELIMDYDSLAMLNVDKLDYIEKLQKNGLTAIAIYPDNIRQILNKGEAQLITGNEVKRIHTLTGQINPSLASFPYNDDSAFFVTYNKNCIEEFRNARPEWVDKYKIGLKLNEEQLVLFFKNWDSKYLSLCLGFNQETIAELKKTNLKIIPRFYNTGLDNSLNWRKMEELSPFLIIFAGEEITGYEADSKEQLKKTAEIMNSNYILFGMIEPFIAQQKGAYSLAHLTDFNLLRVHSIQQKEMDERLNYDERDIVERYMRAVRERNVRLLYLKPFLRAKDNIASEERTLSFINNLSNELKEAGYKPGSLQTYSKYQSNNILLVLTGTGIIIAGALLLNYIFRFKNNKYYYLFIIAGIIGQIVLIFIGKELFLRKFLALGAAVIFPSLAIITQLLDGKEEGWLLKFIKACLISLLGAIFLAASLAHITFILYIDKFAGVKLSFILPVILVSIYYFFSYIRLSDENLFNKTSELLETEIKIKHLLLFFVLALGGLIYIVRTGNNPIIPVSNLEVLSRDLLERFLYIRPRFKELIGHPCFIISLILAYRGRYKLYYYPLIILATIAQINILNTFSHVHTPLYVSLIRTFHGIWLGLLIGIVLVVLLRFFTKYLDRKRGRYYV